MLLSLAIGAMNGGKPQPSLFPLQYEVDYIRVAQKTKGKYVNTKTYYTHDSSSEKPLTSNFILQSK